MVQPTPTPVPASDVKSYTGPYDGARNGMCACHGTPVNGFGRCEPLNRDAVLPTDSEGVK